MHTRQDFVRLTLAEFPELAVELDEWSDLLHLQVGALSRLAQTAKGEGDWDRYRRCMRIADELFHDAAPDLENALNVSFLEHLDFDGPRGSQAWSCLSPRLQRAWKEMQDYLEKIHGASLKKPKR